MVKNPRNTDPLHYFCNTSFCHDGWWYGYWSHPPAKEKDKSFKGAFRTSMEDGHHEAVKIPGSKTPCSPILAGSRVYIISPGQLYPKGSNRPLSTIDGVSNKKSVVHDLKTGKTTKVPVALVDKRLLEDSDYAIRNLATKGGHQMSNASPSAQANRLFHRTKGVLYCIGDPKEPFPVSESWPSQGRISK